MNKTNVTVSENTNHRITEQALKKTSDELNTELKI